MKMRDNIPLAIETSSKKVMINVNRAVTAMETFHLRILKKNDGKNRFSRCSDMRESFAPHLLQSRCMGTLPTIDRVLEQSGQGCDVNAEYIIV